MAYEIMLENKQLQMTTTNAVKMRWLMFIKRLPRRGAGRGTRSHYGECSLATLPSRPVQAHLHRGDDYVLRLLEAADPEGQH